MQKTTATASGGSAAGLRAGVARSNITSCAKGARIHDPLYTKALALDDGQMKVVIVTMDVTAIGGRGISRWILDDVADDFLPRLRGRIEKELNIPGGNLLVNASHTHPPGSELRHNKCYRAKKER